MLLMQPIPCKTICKCSLLLKFPSEALDNSSLITAVEKLSFLSFLFSCFNEKVITPTTQSKSLAFTSIPCQLLPVMIRLFLASVVQFIGKPIT